MKRARNTGFRDFVSAEERLLRGLGGPTRSREHAGRRSPRTSLRSVLLAGIALAGLAVVLFLLSGCGYGNEVKDGGPVTTAATGGPGSQPENDTSSTTEPGQATTTTTPSAETTRLSVYFTRDEVVAPVHRDVPATKAVAAAAIKALLEGPTAAEQEAGFYTAIPERTLFLGVSVTDGVATVDLSREYESGGGSLSMGLRLAQVVYTLTQFPTIDAVQFRLDGKPVEVFGGEGLSLDHPVDRADYEDYLTPAILVESPTFDEQVESPLRITGTANVFEATFQINIVDGDGRIIADQTVTATSGSGERGTFDVTVPFDAGQWSRGALIVFEYSAKDGSQQNVVEIPLRF